MKWRTLPQGDDVAADVDAILDTKYLSGQQTHILKDEDLGYLYGLQDAGLTVNDLIIGITTYGKIQLEK